MLNFSVVVAALLTFISLHVDAAPLYRPKLNPDHRVWVQSNDFPAIGRLVRIDNKTGVVFPFCSATIVQTGVILTAAHCSYLNEDSKVYFESSDTRYARFQVKALLKKGLKDLFGKYNMSGDWAYMKISNAARGIKPIPILKLKKTEVDKSWMLYAFGFPEIHKFRNVHTERLVVDRCHRTNDSIREVPGFELNEAADHRVIISSCRITMNMSGGPLMIWDPVDGYKIIGLHVDNFGDKFSYHWRGVVGHTWGASVASNSFADQLSQLNIQP